MIFQKKIRVQMCWTKKIKISLLVIGFSLHAGYLFSQEDKSNCVLQLEQAQIKYDQGRIQDVAPLVETCLANNEFDKANQTHALKLLTLSYLFLEEPDQAEETILELLKTNHELVINPAIDPSEFINLYEKFRHDPIFNIGGHFTFAFGSPIITHLNGTPNLNNDIRQSYSPLLGIRAGLNIEYKLTNKIFLLGEINYQNIEFEKEHKQEKIISNEFNGGFKGAEEIVSLEMPLLVRYHFLEKNKLKLYGAIGVAPQFLLSESYQSDATTFAIDGSGLVTSNKIDLTNDRSRFNLSAIGVLGIKYKIDEGYLNIRLRYSQQVLNSSNPENSSTPTDPDLLWDLTESYDGFRMQDVGFSIGYTRNIYIPKKLR